MWRTAIPPSAGARPPVAIRRCPSASILVGDLAPSSAAISLCLLRAPSYTHTHTDPIKSAQKTEREQGAESNQPAPGADREELLSWIPAEIGGGGGAAAEAGEADHGRAPRGECERRGEARRGRGEGVFYLSGYYPALTPIVYNGPPSQITFTPGCAKLILLA